MPDHEPTTVFDTTEFGTAGASRPADNDVADRRTRAARIRSRSLELIDALGPDHPLVAEALARADALDGGVTSPATLDLRSEADLSG